MLEQSQETRKVKDFFRIRSLRHIKKLVRDANITFPELILLGGQVFSFVQGDLQALARHDLQGIVGSHGFWAGHSISGVMSK
jgi:hypothetical protein